MKKVGEPDAIGQEKLSEEAEENLKDYLMVILTIFEEVNKEKLSVANKIVGPEADIKN